jgi:hypothetical protein
MFRNEDYPFSFFSISAGTWFRLTSLDMDVNIMSSLYNIINIIHNASVTLFMTCF